MNPLHKRLFSAAASTFLPPRYQGDWHGGDATSMAIIEEYMRRSPWWMFFALAVGLHVLNVSPLILIGKPRSFLSLNEDERLACLTKFSRTMPFALIFAPVRAIFGICIYARPDAIAEIGYSNAGKT